MKKITVLLVTISMFYGANVFAQAWGYNNNRIAISADGNNAADYKDKWPKADPDDWGASPAAMAIIAKLKLQDKVVHYSFNNFVEANVGPDSENIMKIGIESGIKRLRFDPTVFFDATKQFNDAKENLKTELAKSTPENPLYFIHMGPAEFFYQCVKECVDEGHKEALANVYILSHSGYNDNHLRRPYHHTIEQAIEYSGNLLHYKRIKDQNGKWDPNVLWNSEKDFSVWYWMRDSADPNINWLYDRLQQHSGGVADISDAGMVYYLLLGDEDGSPSKFKDFLGDEIVPNPIVHPTDIKTEVDKYLVFVGQTNTINTKVEPELTSNKKLIWKSSNNEIATVEGGKVYGVVPGNTQITASTEDGYLKAVVDVVVEVLQPCSGKIVLEAIADFDNLNVDGFAQAYKDNSRGAIAINPEEFKDTFAAAFTTFRGKTGLYDITVSSMMELDGESTYRLRVGNRLIGEFQNPETETDYKLNFHVFRRVTISNNEKIQIESNPNSNFKIPEGDGFAFARGRWKQIDIDCADTNIARVESKALIILEAEDFELKGTWKKVQDTIASKGNYIVYEGPTHYEKFTDAETIELKFEVTNPGVYTLKWSMRQPDGVPGDLCNDAWIDFPDAIQSGGNIELTGFNKFVSRSSKVFAYGGQLDLHGNQPWMHVLFEKPGTYTLKISGRSDRLQIDRFILYKGMDDTEAKEKAFNINEN